MLSISKFRSLFKVTRLTLSGYVILSKFSNSSAISSHELDDGHDGSESKFCDDESLGDDIRHDCSSLGIIVLPLYGFESWLEGFSCL